MASDSVANSAQITTLGDSGSLPDVTLRFFFTSGDLPHHAPASLGVAGGYCPGIEGLTFFANQPMNSCCRSVGCLAGAVSLRSAPCSALQPDHSRKAW